MDWNEIKGIHLLEGDCMDYMASMPDKCFELAICDPPYFAGPEIPGYYHENNSPCKNYKNLSSSWDIPLEPYWIDLKRISINQILWGINYYDFAVPGGRIIWVKMRNNSPFSKAEIAYQSFTNRVDLFEFLWSGYWQGDMKNKEKRIHPTQKPVALYEWLLRTYAKPGDKILDTHAGSFSSAIACHNLGFDGVFIEKDADYFEAGKRRVEMHQRQGRLF